MDNRVLRTTMCTPHGPTMLHVRHRRSPLRTACLVALLAASALLVCAPVALCLPAVTFAPVTTYAAGVGACTLAIGDVNRDGRSDIVTANGTATAGVSVLLAKAGGGFEGPRQLDLTSNARAVAIGDFDKDAKPDIAVRYSPRRGDSGGVAILRGLGAGDFAAAIVYPTGHRGSDLYVTDLSGDGRSDVVLSNSTADTVSVYFTDASGVPSLHGEYPVGDSPAAVAATDMNADGKYDLISANSGSATASASVTVLSSTSSGFVTHSYLAVAGASDLAIGDFNRDGRRDFAVVGSGDRVGVCLADAIGGFGPLLTYPFCPTPSSIITRDLNYDGYLDLATANVDWGTVAVVLGKGDGTFSGAATYLAGPEPVAIDGIDADKDGTVDLLTASKVGAVSVLLNTSVPILSITKPAYTSSAIPGLKIPPIWVEGGTGLVSWTLGGQLYGECQAVLVAPSGGWILSTFRTVPVVAGRTSYSVNLPVAAPPALGYRVRLSWRGGTASSVYPRQVSSVAFDVAPKITVTRPQQGIVCKLGSTQTFTWSLGTPVAVGLMNVGLADATGHLHQLTSVSATAGQRDYSRNLPLNVPKTGADYRAYVTWRGGNALTHGSVTAYGPRFIIQPNITVTAPLAGARWAVGSSHQVNWKLNAPVQNGEFRVSLVTPNGGWYIKKSVAPREDAMYNTTITVPSTMAPASGYHVCVTWRPISGTGDSLSSGWSGAITMTP
jgi:hypothetical protein